MKRKLWFWMGHAIFCLLLGARFAQAEDFSGTLLVKPAWVHTKTNATTVSESIDTMLLWTHTSGHSTNQMNQLWVASGAIAAGGTNTHNIAGGVTNNFGTVLTVAEVRVFAVSAGSGNAGALTVGGAAANAFSTPFGDVSDKVVVRPGGFAMLVAPDVTAYVVSTNGKIQIVNGGTNTATYSIYVGGADQ